MKCEVEINVTLADDEFNDDNENLKEEDLYIDENSYQDDVHENDEEHSCNFCSKVFLNSRALKKHITHAHKEHRINQTFSCELCYVLLF